MIRLRGSEVHPTELPRAPPCNTRAILITTLLLCLPTMVRAQQKPHPASASTAERDPARQQQTSAEAKPDRGTSILEGTSPNQPPSPKLVPDGWDPALAGDQVLERLIKVTAPQVKGAHDAEFVCVGDRAYVVEM